MPNNSHPAPKPNDIVRILLHLSRLPRFDHIPNSRKVCKHSYSGDTIREYLSLGVKKCPAAGCNKKITLTDLKEDKALERKVKEHARRAAMRAEDEDVDAEVID